MKEKGGTRAANQPSQAFLSKRYLVTGGCGFLGRYLVEHLVKCGAQVRVFDIVSLPSDFEHREDIEWLRGDIRRFADCSEAVRGIDVVFHCASLTHPWAPKSDYVQVNVVGTQNIIAASLANSVTQIIYASTSQVVNCGQDIQNGDESLAYPDYYLDHYSHSKSHAEQRILKTNGLKNKDGEELLTLSIRPHSMFGPRDTHFIAQLVKQAANGSITHMVGEGLNVTDFTYVENAVYAFTLATEGLERNAKIGGKCYFITNGRPVFFWTFILRLLDACGCPRPTKKMSWSVAWTLACVMEFFHWVFGWMWNWYPPVTRSMVSTMSRHAWYSHAKASRDLHYHPIITTEDGLLRTASWFKDS